MSTDMNFNKANSVKKNNRLLINSDDKYIKPILNTMYKTLVYTIDEKYDLTDLKEYIIKASELLEKSDTFQNRSAVKIGKMQSVGWYYINEFLNKDLDDKLLNALNSIFITMSTTFEELDNKITSSKVDKINVANDLNQVMSICKYPISFHRDTYGRVNNKTDMLKHINKSYLRRPIAKVELILAWAAELLRNARSGELYNDFERKFVKSFGIMIHTFIRRSGFIEHNLYDNPCIDELAFIRLMEIVYLNHCPDEVGVDLYRSIHHTQALFSHIRDFNDIRLSNDSKNELSHVSYLPRILSESYEPGMLFYNGVECTEGNPIYDATSAWIDAKKSIMIDRTFRNIQKYTALATFGYEKKYAVRDSTSLKNMMKSQPAWYRNAIQANLLRGPDFDERFEALRGKLDAIKTSIKKLFLSKHIEMFNGGKRVIGELDPSNMGFMVTVYANDPSETEIVIIFP